MMAKPDNRNKQFWADTFAGTSGVDSISGWSKYIVHWCPQLSNSDWDYLAEMFIIGAQVLTEKGADENI